MNIPVAKTWKRELPPMHALAGITRRPVGRVRKMTDYETIAARLLQERHEDKAKLWNAYKQRDAMTAECDKLKSENRVIKREQDKLKNLCKELTFACGETSEKLALVTAERDALEELEAITADRDEILADSMLKRTRIKGNDNV